MPYLSVVRTISLSLSILAALNWGLVGVIDFDLVAYVLGVGSPLGRCIYLLMGCAGFLLAVDTFYCKGSCIQTNS